MTKFIKPKIQEIINKHKKVLDSSYNIHENVIKINSGNTLKHEIAKFLICFEMKKDNRPFITEAIFENGKRADIYDLLNGEAIEILGSETIEMFNEKVKDYPCHAISLDADNVIDWYKKKGEL